MYRSSGAERLYIKNACRSAALRVLWTQIARESFMTHYKPRSFCKIVKDVWYHIVESDDASEWILRRISTVPIKDHGVHTGNVLEKEFYTTLSQVCAACPSLGTPQDIYLAMESGRT